MFCPLTTMGPGRKLVLQAAVGERLVVDCKANPAALVGHVKTISAPDTLIVSCGANFRLNTVPLPVTPPYGVVPYKVLPDKTKPADGLAPSLLV